MAVFPTAVFTITAAACATALANAFVRMNVKVEAVTHGCTFGQTVPLPKPRADIRFCDHP